MNARALRHDWPGVRAGLGLLGILILGLGCRSSAPAAQEPAPAPEPSAVSEPAPEPAPEPPDEPAPSTAPASAGAAGDAPAGEAEQASAQPAAAEQASAQQPADTEAERVAAAPEPSGKLLQLIQDSEKAGREGLFGKAHRLCSQALEIEPGQPRAGMVCAIAACNLGNKRLARRYYALAATEQQEKQIYQICRSKGIELRE